MKTDEEIIKEANIRLFDEDGLASYKITKEALKIQREEIVEEINENIDYQKNFLTKNFKQDRPVNWRILGLELLRNKIIKLNPELLEL